MGFAQSNSHRRAPMKPARSPFGGYIIEGGRRGSTGRSIARDLRTAEDFNLQFASEAKRALDTAVARGADYADVRFGSVRDEHVEVRNGNVSGFHDGESAGFSVRVFRAGAWGFASSAVMTDGEIDRVAGLAVDIAKASAKVKGGGITLAPAGKYVDAYSTPREVDPSTVSLDERVKHLLDVEKEVRAAKGVTVGKAWIDVWRTN